MSKFERLYVGLSVVLACACAGSPAVDPGTADLPPADGTVAAGDLATPSDAPDAAPARPDGAPGPSSDAPADIAPPPDTAPPTIAFANLSDGTSVSGAFTVHVMVADDTAVASVTYFVAGAAVATVTVPPFGYAWATAAMPSLRPTQQANGA